MLLRFKMYVLIVFITKFLPLSTHHFKLLLIFSDYLKSFFFFFCHHVQFWIVKFGLLILFLKWPKPELTFHSLLFRWFKLFQLLWDNLCVWRRCSPFFLDNLFFVIINQIHSWNKIWMKGIYITHLYFNQIADHFLSLI